MTSRNDSRLEFVLGVLVGQEVTVTVRGGCGCGCGCVAGSGRIPAFGTGFRSAGSGSEVDASGGRRDGAGDLGDLSAGWPWFLARAVSPGGESSSRNFAYCPSPEKWLARSLTPFRVSSRMQVKDGAQYMGVLSEISSSGELTLRVARLTYDGTAAVKYAKPQDVKTVGMSE